MLWEGGGSERNKGVEQRVLDMREQKRKAELLDSLADSNFQLEGGGGLNLSPPPLLFEDKAHLLSLSALDLEGGRGERSVSLQGEPHGEWESWIQEQEKLKKEEEEAYHLKISDFEFEGGGGMSRMKSLFPLFEDREQCRALERMEGEGGLDALKGNVERVEDVWRNLRESERMLREKEEKEAELAVSDMENEGGGMGRLLPLKILFEDKLNLLSIANMEFEGGGARGEGAEEIWKTINKRKLEKAENEAEEARFLSSQMQSEGGGGVLLSPPPFPLFEDRQAELKASDMDSEGGRGRRNGEDTVDPDILWQTLKPQKNENVLHELQVSDMEYEGGGGMRCMSSSRSLFEDLDLQKAISNMESEGGGGREDWRQKAARIDEHTPTITQFDSGKVGREGRHPLTPPNTFSSKKSVPPPPPQKSKSQQRGEERREEEAAQLMEWEGGGVQQKTEVAC